MDSMMENRVEEAEKRNGKGTVIEIEEVVGHHLPERKERLARGQTGNCVLIGLCHE
jgi:hypothetical protein